MIPTNHHCQNWKHLFKNSLSSYVSISSRCCSSSSPIQACDISVIQIAHFFGYSSWGVSSNNTNLFHNSCVDNENKLQIIVDWFQSNNKTKKSSKKLHAAGPFRVNSQEVARSPFPSFLKFYSNCHYPIWWTSAKFEWNLSRNGMIIKLFSWGCLARGAQIVNIWPCL